MLAKIKLYAILALIPLLVFAVYQWRSEIRNAAQWAVGFQQLEQAIAEQEERFRADREQRGKEEAQRIALHDEIQSLRRQQEQMTRQFHELERTDEEVADWASGRLPSALVPDRLRMEGADRGHPD
jgi:Sec-independent protein translocase protein TatA